MEPAPGERDDAHTSISVMTMSAPPQWSPLQESGMTRCLVLVVQAEEAAAMEPAPGERDDWQVSAGLDSTQTPQWSPLQESGMTVAAGATFAYAGLPQWSPLQESGMTSARAMCSSWTSCRNGARSRRAG